jgi:hypothetical protein
LEKVQCPPYFTRDEEALTLDISGRELRVLDLVLKNLGFLWPEHGD